MAVVVAAQAQCLTLKHRYTSNWNGEEVGTANKPNGYIYRLRDEVQKTGFMVIPRVENCGHNMKLEISEKIPTGWMTLFRNDLSEDDYAFFVVFYDDDMNPVQSVDLCEISNTYNCEVQDIRWDSATHHLLFNMACPSYASGVGGKGSKLFCYDMESEKMVWSTPYLTSNDIFILHNDFVFCGYGFTGEKDYILMVDKNTGKIYSKLPLASAHQYMEVQNHNGKDQLYVVDYNEYLYIYDINKTSPKPAARKTTARKPVRKK